MKNGLTHSEDETFHTHKIENFKSNFYYEWEKAVQHPLVIYEAGPGQSSWASRHCSSRNSSEELQRAFFYH